MDREEAVIKDLKRSIEQFNVAMREAKNLRLNVILEGVIIQYHDGNLHGFKIVGDIKLLKIQKVIEYDIGLNK